MAEKEDLAEEIEVEGLEEIEERGVPATGSALSRIVFLFRS